MSTNIVSCRFFFFSKMFWSLPIGNITWKSATLHHSVMILSSLKTFWRPQHWVKPKLQSLLCKLPFFAIACTACLNQIMWLYTECKQTDGVSGGWHFLRKGGPKFTKSRRQWNWDPLFRQQICYDPPITDTPYPLNRLKLYWNQFFEHNKPTILWSFCDSLHFARMSSQILWPPYFSFQKFMGPQYIWDPPSEENASPLNKRQNTVECIYLTMY